MRFRYPVAVGAVRLTLALAIVSVVVTTEREARATGEYGGFSPNTITFATIPAGSTSTLAVLFLHIDPGSQGGSIMLGSPYIAGTDASWFSVAPGGTCAPGLVLHASESCELRVMFAPPVPKANVSATLWLGTTDEDVAYVEAALDLHGQADPPLAIEEIPTFTPAGIALLTLALCGLGCFILRRR